MFFFLLENSSCNCDFDHFFTLFQRFRLQNEIIFVHYYAGTVQTSHSTIIPIHFNLLFISIELLNCSGAVFRIKGSKPSSEFRNRAVTFDQHGFSEILFVTLHFDIFLEIAFESLHKDVDACASLESRCTVGTSLFQMRERSQRRNTLNKNNPVAQNSLRRVFDYNTKRMSARLTL